MVARLATSARLANEPLLANEPFARLGRPAVYPYLVSKLRCSWPSVSSSSSFAICDNTSARAHQDCRLIDASGEDRSEILWDNAAYHLHVCARWRFGRGRRLLLRA